LFRSEPTPGFAIWPETSGHKPPRTLKRELFPLPFGPEILRRKIKGREETEKYKSYP
jgi:hypothetical protein